MLVWWFLNNQQDFQYHLSELRDRRGRLEKQIARIKYLTQRREGAKGEECEEVRDVL